MAGPTRQDEYPPSEFGGKPLRNMGGIQPNRARRLPEFFTEGEIPARSESERYQALKRTGDEMGTKPVPEYWDGILPYPEAYQQALDEGKPLPETLRD